MESLILFVIGIFLYTIYICTTSDRVNDNGYDTDGIIVRKKRKKRKRPRTPPRKNRQIINK